jgi:hypothetical protein
MYTTKFCSLVGAAKKMKIDIAIVGLPRPFETRLHVSAVAVLPR